jgi:arsenate reductase (glutaredoxin)
MAAKIIELYGIKNCDTVKKSLKWLEQNDFEVNFHDFKKEAISPNLTEQWLNQIDPAILINRRGTTWRKLSDEQKALTEPDDLSALIIENSSLVKRPVVLFNGDWSVGFNADDWQQRLL